MRTLKDPCPAAASPVSRSFISYLIPVSFLPSLLSQFPHLRLHRRRRRLPSEGERETDLIRGGQNKQL